MIACMCAWCGCIVLEEESNEVAIRDKKGELTGYELVCDLCCEYLIEEIAKALNL